MPEHFLQVKVHRSLEPEMSAEQLTEALATGFTPTRLLYLNPRQARQWQRLASSHSPAQRRDDGAVSYEQIHSGATERLAGADSVQIVGLGCGDGRKEALLASAFPPGTNLSFVPVDASLPLIQIAARAIPAYQPLESELPILADLESVGDELAAMVPRKKGASRVVTLYGVLPWMDTRDAIGLARELLVPGDLLCVSGNLYSNNLLGRGSLKDQYDNPETRAWIEMMLEDLGLGERSGELAIEIASDQAAPRVTGSFTLLQAASVDTGDGAIEIREGTVLRVFQSVRHSIELLEMAVANGGLKVHERAVSPSGEEGVVLAGL